MERYASLLLYLSPKQIRKQYIIELNDHRVSRFYSFIEEIESTVWLGGIIILSTNPEYLMKENMSFENLLQELNDLPPDFNKEYINSQLIYAYHLSAIDTSSMALLPNVYLKRL